MNYEQWKSNTKTRYCKQCHTKIPWHNSRRKYCNDKCKKDYRKKDQKLKEIIE